MTIVITRENKRGIWYVFPAMNCYGRIKSKDKFTIIVEQTFPNLIKK